MCMGCGHIVHPVTCSMLSEDDEDEWVCVTCCQRKESGNPDTTAASEETCHASNEEEKAAADNVAQEQAVAASNEQPVDDGVEAEPSHHTRSKKRKSPPSTIKKKKKKAISRMQIGRRVKTTRKQLFHSGLSDSQKERLPTAHGNSHNYYGTVKKNTATTDGSCLGTHFPMVRKRCPCFAES